jgi:hypothetical protein
MADLQLTPRRDMCQNVNGAIVAAHIRQLLRHPRELASGIGAVHKGGSVACVVDVGVEHQELGPIWKRSFEAVIASPEEGFLQKNILQFIICNLLTYFLKNL